VIVLEISDTWEPITDELHIDKEKEGNSDEGIRFTDIGRLKLNRKKQKEGIEGLRNAIESSDMISEKLNSYLLEQRFPVFL
jgi:hypothetical protein